MTEAMSKGDGDGNRGETETPNAHPESARCLLPVPPGAAASPCSLCTSPAGLSTLLLSPPERGAGLRLVGGSLSCSFYPCAPAALWAWERLRPGPDMASNSGSGAPGAAQ